MRLLCFFMKESMKFSITVLFFFHFSPELKHIMLLDSNVNKYAHDFWIAAMPKLLDFIILLVCLVEKCLFLVRTTATLLPY